MTERLGLNKAIFIDKDGTLISDIPYNVNPNLISLQEKAIDGLQLLQKERYLLIIVSNQSGIARGYFKEEDLLRVQIKIEELLSKHDIDLDGFYYCPHLTDAEVKEYAIECNCRKPEPGLLLSAAKDFNIHLPHSWMIGDILNDIEAGKRAGCKTILINNGNETEWNLTPERTPDYTAQHLLEAAQYILDYSKKLEEPDEQTME